jgi:hypothetical protein
MINIHLLSIKIHIYVLSMDKCEYSEGGMSGLFPYCAEITIVSGRLMKHYTIYTDQLLRQLEAFLHCLKVLRRDAIEKTNKLRGP